MKKQFVIAAVVALSLTGVARAADDNTKLDTRIEAAHTVLHELMGTRDKGYPAGYCGQGAVRRRRPRLSQHATGICGANLLAAMLEGVE